MAVARLLSCPVEKKGLERKWKFASRHADVGQALRDRHFLLPPVTATFWVSLSLTWVEIGKPGNAPGRAGE